MAQQKYTKAIVYVDGGKLTQETKVTVRRTTGSQPVKTVAGGYSGESPGSAMVEITVDNAVPSADFELNPGAYMKSLASAEVTLFAAGSTLTSKGCIYEDNFSHGESQVASISFSFRGQFADWE